MSVWKKLLFVSVPATLLALAVALPLLFRERRQDTDAGMDTNRWCWEQTYVERELPVPEHGPREGFWGSRLPANVDHAELGWHHGAVSVLDPPLLEVDERGHQHYASKSGDTNTNILILGGSVAFGAYASEIDKTYFAVMANQLADAGQPVRLTVAATGAWKSIQEIRALKMLLQDAPPDHVLLINGLNDLTCGPTSKQLYNEGPEDDPLYHAFDYEQRATDYLNNMERACDLVEAADVPLTIVLQPSLAECTTPTQTEKMLLAASLTIHKSRRSLTDAYATIRAGLTELADQRDVLTFLDCSTLFDAEESSTFADMWHFSDPGHALMGSAIARHLQNERLRDDS